MNVDDETFKAIALMELDPVGVAFIESLKTLQGVPSEDVLKEHACLFWRINPIQRYIAWAHLQKNVDYLFALHPIIGDLMVWTARFGGRNDLCGPGANNWPPCPDPGLSPCGELPNGTNWDLTKIWFNCWKARDSDFERYRIIRDKIKNRNSV